MSFVTLAGDTDRERAVAALREHFVGGRLTADELSDRTHVALRARSRAELRRALAGLPQFSRRGLAEAALRGAALVVLTGIWLVFSFVLLVVFALTLLIHGASLTLLVAVVVTWLLPTFLLSRRWQRALPRRTSSA
jgi:Flp pilus assembly protein TadB